MRMRWTKVGFQNKSTGGAAEMGASFDLITSARKTPVPTIAGKVGRTTALSVTLRSDEPTNDFLSTPNWIRDARFTGWRQNVSRRRRVVASEAVWSILTNPPNLERQRSSSQTAGSEIGVHRQVPSDHAEYERHHEHGGRDDQRSRRALVAARWQWPAQGKP